VRFSAAAKVAVLVALANWIYQSGLDALGDKLALPVTDLRHAGSELPLLRLRFADLFFAVTQLG
jgi:hypothetical protein